MTLNLNIDCFVVVCKYTDTQEIKMICTCLTIILYEKKKRSPRVIELDGKNELVGQAYRENSIIYCYNRDCVNDSCCCVIAKCSKSLRLQTIL